MVDQNALWRVVLNDEEQYSIWPAGQAVPAGWRPVGAERPKDECLAYIDEAWTDMRPKSLRDKIRERQSSATLHPDPASAS